MWLVYLAWRNLKARPVVSWLTVVAVALGVAMGSAGMVLQETVRDGARKAAAPFDIIVGAKGSSTQLVMNTIFLQDVPLGNIPEDLVHVLSDDPRVASVIPMAFGDNVHGHRIVGTVPDFFGIRAKPSDPPLLRLDRGRMFAQPMEAVLGSRAAARLRLSVGDTFHAEHGVIEAATEEAHEEHEEEEYTVVGILAPSGTPLDAGVFTPMESVWSLHHLEEGHQDVTALLVRPKSVGGLMQLHQQINNLPDAQAVFPGEVMGKLFDMLGQSEGVLQALFGLVLVLSALTVVVALVGAGAQRRREVAIMRSVGAPRQKVFWVMLAESALVGGIGTVFGLIAGHTLAVAVQWWLAGSMGVVSQVRIAPGEGLVITTILLLSLLAGVLPAWSVSRVEVARELAHT